MDFVKWLAVACAVAVPGTVFAAGEMREGQWELTSTVEMPGMPMKMAPQVVKHCYTRDDVKDQKRVIAREKDCRVEDFKSSGNKVSWKMVCTGKNKGTFSGETVFSGDSYVSNMKMKAEGQTMNMKVKGKRLGNCP